jgi:hypothetical protein
LEIKPVPPDGGEIVWKWSVWDHLIQSHDPSKKNYGDPANHPELIDVDANGGRIRAFWNHMNSIDYNPKLDQIMLSVRGCSELWVIDHSTTTEEAARHSGGRYDRGGDLLYRWGNPQAYEAGTNNDQRLFQQHDAQWIEPGLPGAGNILIFNNGLSRATAETAQRRQSGQRGRTTGGYSSVDEIVPPMNPNGSYRLDKGEAFEPREPKWTYFAENKSDFYAEAISGCQRLPNGNTLICDGTSGVFFEVTPEKEMVWKYVCPADGAGPLEQGDPIPIDHRGHAMNAVFKIHRYSDDYPGLKGKDLTPGPKVIGSDPGKIPENLSRQPARSPRTGRRPG